MEEKTKEDDENGRERGLKILFLTVFIIIISSVPPSCRGKEKTKVRMEESQVVTFT